jgi:hypothetical protein
MEGRTGEKELQEKAYTCIHKTNYEGCRLYNICENEKKG